MADFVVKRFSFFCENEFKLCFTKRFRKLTPSLRICITLQIDSAFEAYDTFFNLSDEVKEKYSKKEGTSPDGWDALERERWV